MTTYQSAASNGYILYIDVRESSPSIPNNNSVANFEVSLYAGMYYMQRNYQKLSVSLDGSTLLNNATIAANFPSQYSKIVLWRGSKTIQHDADGSKSINVSATFTTDAPGLNYTPNGSMTVSGTFKMSTIARATVPTLSYADISHRLGTNLTINLPRAASAFTHKVTYEFGKATGTITESVATSTVWKMPKSLANEIPNSLIGTGKIIVETFNGMTSIGTKTIDFTVQVSDDMIPAFTGIGVTRVDNGVPANFGIYVQGLSKATLKINGAVGSYGSTIKSYSITSDDGQSSNESFATLGPFNKTDVITFTATITDSRGRSVSKITTITVYKYAPPTLTVTVERCTSNGTPDNRGTYVKISPVYSCESVNRKNYITSKSFSIEGTSYKDTTCATGASVVLGAGTLAVSKSYVIKAVVTDAIGNQASLTIILLTAQVPFNINQKGNAICINGYATKENTFTAYSNGKYIQFEYIENNKAMKITTDADYIYFNKPIWLGGSTIKFSNGTVHNTDNMVFDE